MDRRANKRASNQCIGYFMDKYRDAFATQENDRRAALQVTEELYTLEQVKTQYYLDLEAYSVEQRGFEQYMREEYEPVYNDRLEFIGYERSWI